ncbi:hypothetical protein [Kribbella sp.]|uniref:hypothetical protein n=1 Tax=Kribbella sp. TaxID=1871183 RepID=UPI002D4B1C9F|nr:hypothetical protein [Kribbella sp.]HZX06608.1 hypothetical protein [Kribbella sp.]
MDPSSSDTSASVKVIAFTFLALVISLPLIGYIVLVWLPLRVNAGATRFTGKYWGWQLMHVTGRVLASQRHTQTTTATEYSTYPGDLGTSTTRTDVYDRLALQLADSRQANVEVVNFNVSAWPGQVVSFWTAVKGRKVFTFAVLNHSTNQQNVNDQQVFRIMLSQPLQIIFVLYLIGLVLPIAFLSVFGGAGVPFLLWLLLLILFVIGQRRVRRSFNKKGIATLWQHSYAEAQPLLQH